MVLILLIFTAMKKTPCQSRTRHALVFILHQCQKHNVCGHRPNDSSHQQGRWFLLYFMPMFLEQSKVESSVNNRSLAMRSTDHANAWFRPVDGNCRVTLPSCGCRSLAFLSSNDRVPQFLTKAYQRSSGSFAVPKSPRTNYKMFIIWNCLQCIMDVFADKKRDTVSTNEWFYSSCNGHSEPLAVSRTIVLILDATITVGRDVWRGVGEGAAVGSICLGGADWERNRGLMHVERTSSDSAF